MSSTSERVVAEVEAALEDYIDAMNMRDMDRLEHYVGYPYLQLDDGGATPRHDRADLDLHFLPAFDLADEVGLGDVTIERTTVWPVKGDVALASIDYTRPNTKGGEVTTGRVIYFFQRHDDGAWKYHLYAYVGPEFDGPDGAPRSWASEGPEAG